MMHWQYTPYVLPLLIAAATSVALAFLAWRRRPAPGARPLVWLMLAVAEWSLGYALELGSAGLPAKVFWAKVEYVGIVAVPVAWSVLALQYTGREKWLARRNLILLAIVPLVTLLLAWTNEAHGLIWSDTRLDTSGSFSVLDLTYGAWFWVNMAYSYLLILLGSFLFLQEVLHSPHLYRGQASALLIGALAPWLGNILYVSGLSPFPHLDLTPFAFTSTGLMLSWGLFHFRLLDIVPVARDAVIESMGDGVLVLDVQDRIVDLNPAAESIFGCAASEAIGRPADQMLSGQSDLVECYRDVTEAHAEIVLDQGDAQHCFDLRISPLHDRRGCLSGRLVVLRDITKRKQAEEALKRTHDELEERVEERTIELKQEIAGHKRTEEALRQSEAKYRALVEQIPALIYTTGLAEASTTFYMSPQIERILGFTQAEWMAGPELWLKQLHPGDRARVLAELARSHDSGEPFIAEYRLLSRDDQVLWFHDEAVVVQGDDGTPLFLQGVMLDITERWLAEEARRQSEERYRAVAETAVAGIGIVDPEENLSFVNPAFAEMLGYTQSELVGMNLSQLVDQEEFARYQELTQWRKEGKPSHYETTFYHKDNNVLNVLVSASPLTADDGSFKGTLAVTVDITERKRAEAALEEERASLARRVAERTAELSAANAELARAARLKDEFLASMSHELRTPLNAILGLSEALQEEVYGPLSEKQFKSLHRIEESGRHLLALINDILDVSKVEAGKLELEIGPVSVESVCRASLGLIKQTAHKKQLKVSSTFDSQVTTIQADERRLKQILVNLLSNAVKFTPEGGTIGLEVVGDAENEAVHLTVWDTGIGISQEDLPRLFQPFVQLDSSLSRQHAGTGLGLALVHRMAEMHRGSVSMESQKGEGSRFTVSLPWRESVKDSRDKGPKLQDEGLSVTNLRSLTFQPSDLQPLILLAEDNEDNINTLLDYLQVKGYRVIVARNGHEAIERAREKRPDVILMDIQMPGMDGLEATRRIRADADASTGLSTGLAVVPIIALTALAMPGDRERCLEAGANEYLSKPVSLRGLVKAIETQLNRNLTGKGGVA